MTPNHSTKGRTSDWAITHTDLEVGTPLDKSRIIKWKTNLLILQEFCSFQIFNFQILLTITLVPHDFQESINTRLKP